MNRLVAVLVMVALSSACSAESSPQIADAPDPIVDPGPASAPQASVTLVPRTPAASTVPTGSVAESGETEPAVARQAVGVVIAVDGDLTEIRQFSLLSEDGDVVEIVTPSGLLFDDGPMAHVRDHLVSGAPVTVTYRIEGGVATATSVGDAS